MESIELWSAKDIEAATDPERKKKGSFANTHLKFIDCVKWTYIVTIISGTAVFLLWVLSTLGFRLCAVGAVP